MQGELKTLRALGGSTRLRIARLLLTEEICVCELEHILGISQPAISQQLRILRDANLLEARREGNWIFYSIEPAVILEAWESVRDVLLSPLGSDPETISDAERLKEIIDNPFENCPERIPRKAMPLKMRYPVEILFLCTGNSCRSQMAEYFTRVYGDSGRIRVESAGTNPAGVHPRTLEIMGELGIDLSAATSKSIQPDSLSQKDLVITLCGDARESCPIVPPTVEKRHWDLPDPARIEGDEAEILQGFRDVRDDISRRVRRLLSELDVVVG